MAKKKKKKSHAPAQKFSPASYLRTKVRDFPFAKILINANWDEVGDELEDGASSTQLATIGVARQQPSGKYVAGMYLVDRLCLGLKSTTFRYNLDEEELDEFFAMLHPEAPPVEVEYPLVHNLIYGSIAYAEDLGFKPDKNFNLTQYILEPDTEDVPLIELEYGYKGKPFFIGGPYDNAMQIVDHLLARLGKDGFEYLVPIGGDGFDFE